MGRARPKQFMLLGGMPILARTINNFAAALPGAEIVVVLPAEHTGFWHNLSARFEVAPHTVAEGGRERFHSVKNGLAALKRDPELIAVQDGVRPLGSQELIRRTVAAAAEHVRRLRVFLVRSGPVLGSGSALAPAAPPLATVRSSLCGRRSGRARSVPGRFRPRFLRLLRALCLFPFAEFHRLMPFRLPTP